MSRYFSIFKISLQQEIAYKANFVMWRIRNVFQIFLVFYLWDAIYTDNSRVLFGYDRAQILTYVFGLMIVRALVLSAKANSISGEIASGDFSNYLLKPINFFKYWMTRDVSSKVLNLIFAGFETFLLFLLLKPIFFLQTNPLQLFSFVISIFVAIFIFSMIVFIVSSIPFWNPELAWGAQFILFAIVIEFLSGALFPIDILPSAIQNILYWTPFPYLIFFPLEIYLGKISGIAIVQGITIAVFWSVALWFFMNSIWRKGLKVYQSHGR